MKRRPSSSSRMPSSQPPYSRWAFLIVGLALSSNSHAAAAAPLDCDTECGSNNNRIQICHFNGHSYQTLCIRRNSGALRQRRRRPQQQQQQQNDYCGPCTSTTKAFDSSQELKDAVAQYVSADVYDVSLADAYGWPLNQWNVSLVEDFSHLFESKQSLSQTESLEGWDVSRATDMSFLFQGCRQWHGNSLRDWNVAKVRNFEGMFHGATQFNGNLEKWQTRSVTSMKRMFQDATHFSQPLGAWDVSHVVDTSHMFAHAKAFDQDLSSWNMEAVRDVSYMFYHSSSVSQDLSSWKLSSVGAMQHMLAGVPAYSSSHQQQQLLEAWKAQMGTSNILARVTIDDVFGTRSSLPAPSPMLPNDQIASSFVMLRGPKTERHSHVHLSQGQPSLPEDHPLPSTLLHRELPQSYYAQRHTTTTSNREERNQTYRNHDHHHDDDDYDTGNDEQESYPYNKCGEGFCDNTVVTSVS